MEGVWALQAPPALEQSLSLLRPTADSFLFPSSSFSLIQCALWVALNDAEGPKKNLEALLHGQSLPNPDLPLPFTCFKHQLRNKVILSCCFLCFSSFSVSSTILHVQTLSSATIYPLHNQNHSSSQNPSQVDEIPSHLDMCA